MSRISQPVGQVRFTNVAMVRYKKGGKKFEVAAYRNKVLSWRNGTEKDLFEVLQTTSVFTNASKGVVANKKELLEVFGTESHEEAAKVILEKGEVEVTDKERGAMIEALTRDVATIVADKCVNPVSKRPYTVSMIITALKNAHFSVNLGKSAKQQALKAIEALASTIAIERAKMSVRVSAPTSWEAEVRDFLLAKGAKITSTTAAAGAVVCSMDILIDPGVFREIDESIATLAGGKATLEVLSLASAGLDVGDAESDRKEATEPAAGAGTVAKPSDDSTAAAARGTGMAVTRVTLPGRKLHCNTCNVGFEKPEEHREHFRSDLHRYNLKLKMRSTEPVSSDAFALLTAAEKDAVLNAME